MVIIEIVNGRIRTPFVGAYLPPLMIDHLPDINEALQRFKVPDPIFLDNLNVDLDGI